MSLLDPQATILALRVPKTLNRQQRVDLADLVIEHIYDRTNRGLDESGKKFKGYSKDYINSLAGKIGGKGSGPVNLQLSGDMLAAMTMLKQSDGQITLGWKDKTERAKAEGNIIGSYGQSSANSKKARPFFGIGKDKLKELIAAVE